MAAVRLTVERGSVATTSASERFVVVRDTVRGHVLDPRTGEPAASWGSATVHAPDPLVADLLSTALFVMGPKEGLAWAEAHEGVGALFLRRAADGVEATWDAQMNGMIERVIDEPQDVDGRTARTHRRSTQRGPTTEDVTRKGRRP